MTAAHATDDRPASEAPVMDRDQQFNLRMSLAELKAWKAAAKASGITLADWIRTACSNALARGGKLAAPIDRRGELARLRKVHELVGEAIADVEASGKVQR